MAIGFSERLPGHNSLKRLARAQRDGVSFPDVL
jgi:hypothetical protein